MQPNMSLAAEIPAEEPADTKVEATTRPGIIAPLKRGRSSRFIGEIVVDLGYADREAVDAAVIEARSSGRNTGGVLVERGILSPYQLARVIAERFGVDFVDLNEFSVDHAAASLIAPETARRYECVPIAFADDRDAPARDARSGERARDRRHRDDDRARRAPVVAPRDGSAR